MQKQILLVSLIFSLMVSLFWALYPAPHFSPAPILTQKPQRIVSQTLATDEILLAICPPERIAALSPLATDSSYSNVAEIAKTMGRSVHNLEQLLALQPDLVLVAQYNRAELLTLLNQVNIPTLKLTRFSQLQDIRDNIQQVGQAIGETDRATELLAQMKMALVNLHTRLPKRPPPRIISYSLEGLTAGKETTFDAIAQEIGAVNVSAEQGIHGVVAISGEQLIAWQPDFIVVAAASTQFDAILQQLRAQPTFQAVRGKIIFIEQRYLLTASHHIITTIEQLAQQIYKQ